MGGSLFDHVTPEMTIYKDEIFGPVLSVVRAKDYEEALALPSTHQYGNGVAIFTQDGDAARDFTARVKVGMVGVNVPIPVPIAYHTFGGWKRSGFGDLNQHGPDSIRFLHQDQDGDAALALGHQERGGVLDPDDAVGDAKSPLPSAGEGGPRVSEGRERGAPYPAPSLPSPDPLRGPPSPAEGGGKTPRARRNRPCAFGLDEDQNAIREMAMAFSAENIAAACPRLGPRQDVSRENPARGGGAGHGRDLRARGCRRLRPLAPRPPA